MTTIEVHSEVSRLVQGIRAAAAVSLEESTTMPPRAYCSDELFQLELDRVFRPGWLNIGRVSDVPNIGDYKCVDLIGEQLVMCRDKEGELRVMSRICLHRWMEVATGSGNAPAFQCPYHLWTYNLSGQLVGAPEMQGVAGFDKSTCSLPQVRHAVWQGFVFVNLDGNAKPLVDEVAPLTDQLATQEYPVDFTDFVKVAAWEWGDGDEGQDCDWDWKVLVENFMECYHHLGPHGQSLQAKSPANMSWTNSSNHAYSLMHPGRSQLAYDEDPTIKGLGNLIHIYPLFIMGGGHDWMSVHTISPLRAGWCRVISEYYAHPSLLAEPDWPERQEKKTTLGISVNREDFAACRGVQKAARARSAAVGRLSLLEQPLWEFYQHLAERLTA